MDSGTWFKSVSKDYKGPQTKAILFITCSGPRLQLPSKIQSYAGFEMFELTPSFVHPKLKFH